MSTQPTMRGRGFRLPSIYGNPDLSANFSNPQIRDSIRANRSVRVLCAHCKGRVYVEHRHDGDYLKCLLCSRERQMTEYADPRGLIEATKTTAYMRTIHHDVLGVLFRAEEGMTLGLIAAIVGYSESATHSAVDNLIGRKMVERIEKKRGPTRFKITQIGADNVL